MNKEILIIGNWKCNPTSLKQAKALLVAISSQIKSNENTEVIICPPFVYLYPLINMLPNKVSFGAQDCFWEQKGAFTGEISPLELKNLGCQYIIVGHSERRRFLKETDEMINKEIKSVLKSRLKPVLCVGEETRDSFNSDGKLVNEMNLIVAEQLEKALMDIPVARIRDIVIAYEPVWAIGTGNPCLSDDAMKAGLFIRKTLANIYDRKVAEKAKIIYGGSVNSKNVNEYVKDARMDGVLVGGASLNASEFVKIIKTVTNDKEN